VTQQQKPAETVWLELKEHYPGVREVVFEDDNTLCAYADDDTLWKMYDELANFFQTVEFNAGDQEQNYIRIVLDRKCTHFK
jgi:hypothetical protein